MNLLTPLILSITVFLGIVSYTAGFVQRGDKETESLLNNKKHGLDY